MFVHLWDVHFDFIPPAPYDTMFDPDYDGPVTGENFFFDPEINARMPGRDKRHLIALYDGEIAWTDEHVGRIIDDLRRAGLLDETVVAVTSDHGTEFFEHGGKAHRMTLFDEVIRVPLIIRYPAGLPAGTRVAAQSRAVDVGPTLLELASLAAPDDIMGSSLLSLTESGPGRVAVSELFSVGRRMRSVRTRQWKLTDHLQAQRRYYFDLVRDPRETRPLSDLAAGRGPEVVETYRTVLADIESWRTRMPFETDPSTIPDEVRRQLESLGYIDGGP